MGSTAPVLPPALAAGSRIALIAPAGPVLDGDDVVRATELCRVLGFEPAVGAHARDKYGYFAGTDAARLADLNAALAAPDIDGVWCLRGGYGVTRLLQGVDYAGFAAHPKPVIGYSDITALHLALYRRTGIVTFHGPVARAAMPDFTRRHFERVLMRTAPAGRLEPLASPAGVLVPHRDRIVPLAGGVAEGRLVGGNLSLVQCLIGTDFLPSMGGAVLFLEDVGEEVYRVDRMLAHLRLAGVLAGLAGVAIGRFTEVGRRGADGALGLEEVLRTYLEPLGVPVVAGLPFGHVDDQWTLPVGVRARLDADAGTLDLLEAGVR